MIETGVVLGTFGPVYWHLPEDRSAVHLGDDRSLWEVLWNSRNEINLGFAHSHPGSGIPNPSMEDLTTFAAVEAGLGRSLDWWITSSDTILLYQKVGSGRFDYQSHKAFDGWFLPIWVYELRNLSGYVVSS